MVPDYLLPFANHLWQSTLFGIAVCLMVLTLRKNRAAVRHRLWLAASVKFLVPFSLLAGIGSHFQWQMASETPPRPVFMIVETISQPFSASGPSFVPAGSTASLGSTPAPQASRFPSVLIGVWICGVAASLFWWFIRWRQVRRAVRLATPANFTGPLRVMYGPERFEPGVFGIFRPVLLLPEGITHRLSPAQLQAVLAHELHHVRRRDNLAMAIHMFVEALFWFHPLVWFVKLRLIEEQERACDEEVLRLGSEPMVYAEGLLKVCEFCVESPSTCVSGVTGSDLKKRVGRIMRNQIGETLNRQRKLALVTVGIAALAMPIVAGMVNASPIRPQTSQTQPPPEASQNASLALGYAASAPQPERPVAQPPRVTPPQAVWTPTSDAPQGLLTRLEGERHNRFIDRARAGDIDIVFFGATATEMWSWPDRGRIVWDQAFGSRKAASFGTQGTRPESLLWRMRNGELDGYQAMVVVLEAFGVGDDTIPDDRRADFVANYAAIIAEVRARQPQAKILIFAAFPRGRLRREPWLRIAEANAAAFAELADDKTVFYIDIGNRFFLPDGFHNQEMWTISGPPDAGIHAPAFQVWAEELQPWLDRFVR